MEVEETYVMTFKSSRHYTYRNLFELKIMLFIYILNIDMVKFHSYFHSFFESCRLCLYSVFSELAYYKKVIILQTFNQSISGRFVPRVSKFFNQSKFTFFSPHNVNIITIYLKIIKVVRLYWTKVSIYRFPIY